MSTSVMAPLLTVRHAELGLNVPLVINPKQSTATGMQTPYIVSYMNPAHAGPVVFMAAHNC